MDMEALRAILVARSQAQHHSNNKKRTRYLLSRLLSARDMHTRLVDRVDERPLALDCRDVELRIVERTELARTSVERPAGLLLGLEHHLEQYGPVVRRARGGAKLSHS